MKLITLLLLDLCSNIQSVMLKSIPPGLLSLNLIWTLTESWSEKQTLFTIDVTCLSFSNVFFIYTWSNNAPSKWVGLLTFKLNLLKTSFEALTPSNSFMLKSPRTVPIFLPTRYCKQSMNSDNVILVIYISMRLRLGYC